MSNERSNWVQMVLSLSINSGGFGVTPNYASRDPAIYAVTARCLAWAGTLQVLPSAHHEFWPSSARTHERCPCLYPCAACI